MKEQFWGKIALRKKEAWGLLVTGLLLGVALALVVERAAVYTVSAHVLKVVREQKQVVQATTAELEEELQQELEEQIKRNAQDKLESDVKLLSEIKAKVELAKDPLAHLRKDTLVGIDPGHLGRTTEGYVNVGAVSVNGVTEYEFTLEIGLLLKEELISRGYNVFMVREVNDRKGYKLTPGDRAVVANEAGCDIVIALHWDSNDDSTHQGYHTIYKTNKKTASYRLALAVSEAYGEAVEGHIAKLRNPMRRKDLWQLNWSTVPMTFIEMGYASNENDALWLTDSSNHPIIVEGIANGIDNYFLGEIELEKQEQNNE